MALPEAAHSWAKVLRTENIFHSTWLQTLNWWQPLFQSSVCLDRFTAFVAELPSTSNAKSKEEKEIMNDRNINKFLDGTYKAVCVCCTKLVAENWCSTKQLPVTDNRFSKYLKSTEWWCAIRHWKYAFLQTHFIPSNTSDWHGEIFQKGISPMEKCYHEKWNPTVLPDFDLQVKSENIETWKCKTILNTSTTNVYFSNP